MYVSNNAPWFKRTRDRQGFIKLDSRVTVSVAH